MHDARPCHADGAAERPSAPVHVPAAGQSGELTVLERLEAFRDLIRHGNTLLGEVVAYCRDAEVAINQFAAEKQDLDRIRGELQEARQRADAEAAAARTALTQVETQQRDLRVLSGELTRARAEIDQAQRAQDENAVALERSLADAKEQQRTLEQELQRVRTQALSSRSLESRLGQLDQVEAKLRITERELSDTRKALEEERSRRDRAIALIKPRQLAAEAQS